MKIWEKRWQMSPLWAARPADRTGREEISTPGRGFQASVRPGKETAFTPLSGGIMIATFSAAGRNHHWGQER